jgi:hypothetical protein
MLLATLLCFAGFTALCLSMTRHYGELLHRRPGRGHSRILKVAGWSCLTLSLWVALASAALGMALVQWFVALMASALLLVFLIPFRPRLVLVLAAAAVSIASLLLVNQLLA